MLRFLKAFWHSLGAISLLSFVFSLPQIVGEMGDNLRPWKRLFSMVDQLTALKVLSVLLVLWVIWSDLRPFILRRLRSEQDALSLSDLAKMAESNYGWKFGNDSYESLDFLDALRQSAVDGTLRILGRADCHRMPEDLKAAYPLVDVPQVHFTRYRIDVPNFFKGTKNYNVSTHFPTESPDGTYRDLHIKTKQDARKWLKEIAPKWRGQREQADKAASADRAKRLEWSKKDEDRESQSRGNEKT